MEVPWLPMVKQYLHFKKVIGTQIKLLTLHTRNLWESQESLLKLPISDEISHPEYFCTCSSPPALQGRCRSRVP